MLFRSQLATDLWAAPLGAAPDPTGTTDPREPWRRAVVLIPGVLLVLLARERRRRRAFQVGAV